jgi:hypothetical protein
MKRISDTDVVDVALKIIIFRGSQEVDNHFVARLAAHRTRRSSSDEPMCSTGISGNGNPGLMMLAVQALSHMMRSLDILYSLLHVYDSCYDY